LDQQVQAIQGRASIVMLRQVDRFQHKRDLIYEPKVEENRFQMNGRLVGISRLELAIKGKAAELSQTRSIVGVERSEDVSAEGLDRTDTQTEY
jgi:hypothetical protein